MNAWTTIVAEDETPYKDRFAELLLRMPHDPFRAACQIFGTDTMRALRVSQSWTYDDYVLQRQAELLRTYGEDEYLPGKAELARRIWLVAENATDNKDKLAAYKLYGEVRNFVARDQVNNNINITHNRVMVMRDFGTDEQWETKAAAQQAKLIEHSRD